MARPSDKEYALQRKIKDLEDQNRKKDERIIQLEKKIEKLEKNNTEVEHKPKKKKENVCPHCGAAIKVIGLPFGKSIILCADACGYRDTKND